MPKKQKEEKEKKQSEEEEKIQKEEKEKKDSDEENKPTESSSNRLERKRNLSKRKHIKEMRQEEAQSSKRALLRKSRMKRGSSISLLSLLIAEEVISASKVEDSDRRIKFQATDDSLNMSKTEHRNVLQESLLTIKEFTHEGRILEESAAKPTQTSSSSSRKASKMIITPKSSTIFSYLLGTQPKQREREEFKKLDDENELIKGAEDETDEKDELLLGYRNIKTNEMKIAAIPANSYIIYEEHKIGGRVFTIVVREQDIPKAAVSSQESIHDAKNQEGFASKQSLAGYVYPSWPKRNSSS